MRNEAKNAKRVKERGIRSRLGNEAESGLPSSSPQSSTLLSKCNANLCFFHDKIPCEDCFFCPVAGLRTIGTPFMSRLAVFSKYVTNYLPTRKQYFSYVYVN